MDLQHTLAPFERLRENFADPTLATYARKAKQPDGDRR